MNMQKTRSKAFQDQLDAMQEQFDEIQELVKQGILGRELCPEPTYWRWPILEPDKLPEKFKDSIPLGEVRW
jgi:hypothetical protein